MALTVVTNPVGSATSKFFAGFQKCELVFKREDLQITDVVSGSGGSKIEHAGDLTSALSEGDTIYFYSEATNYTYNTVCQILSIVAGEIVVNTPFIETGTGGYINYRKNYYVELQCVHPTLPDVNLLPFSLESDGDAAGNIKIDVSIVNQLNTQRGIITQGFISDSVKEFEVKYREVYSGSSNGFTLIDNKLFMLLFAIEEPTQDLILNKLDEPLIILGYPNAFVVAAKSTGATTTFELTYKELDNNKGNIVTGTLGVLPGDTNGFRMWKWLTNTTVNQSTAYLEFESTINATFPFDDNLFDSDYFVTN